MNFVTFPSDEHADAFLEVMRRLEAEKGQEKTFCHNRGYILERFRDVVIAVEDEKVKGFYISKEGPDDSRVVEFIQAFEKDQGVGSMMLDDLCERYEPDDILCFEPVEESVWFWKRAGIRSIDRDGNIRQLYDY